MRPRSWDSRKWGRSEAHEEPWWCWAARRDRGINSIITINIAGI